MLLHWTIPYRRPSIALALLFAALLAAPLRAVTWFPLGPFGGDARAFAADPRDPEHLYLGTATGWVYESRDGGVSWRRLSQIAHRNDLVIDHILADVRSPQRLVVGAWKVDGEDGGIFISEDGGKTWFSQIDMNGQSVRSLARSASDPNEIIAGTLRGIFRSADNGIHWKAISPAGSSELHEVQSIAVDPADPSVIYAGTWHLPWKTTDGGRSWTNIKRGMIDDSDVFSILIDPANPQIVYASACSGIYKSSDAASEFHKVNGIPNTARRTRKLMQDPQHLNTVYAGTTEGLYRTLDAGEHWDRMTPPDVIVNDVYVDPSNPDHVLLATDHGGVLLSADRAQTFQPSNTGFSARQVAAYTSDPHNPALLYVGVVNDKETGGVFASSDGGLRWHQQSAGLGGHDVFSLGTTIDGVVLAGTNHGIYRLQDGVWADSSQMLGASAAHATARTSTAESAHRLALHAATPAAARLDARVFTLAGGAPFLYAGTSQGLLRGEPAGFSWSRVPALELPGNPEVRFLAIRGSTLVAAGLKAMALSADGGVAWTPVPMPHGLTQLGAVALDSRNRIWAGGREGLFYSADAGVSWSQIPNLSIAQVDAIYFDPAGDRILATTAESTFVFSVHVPDLKVVYWDTGWKLRFARPVGSYIAGATLYDGIVVQPRMVDTASTQR